MTRRSCSRAWGFAILLFAATTVSAEPPDVRHEIRFPDIPGYRTLKCDFHMHTVFSDGDVWPTVRVLEAWREGLDAISITDHVEYRPHKADGLVNLQHPYDIALETARQRNILLVRGVEFTHDTPPGHFNAIFVTDANAFGAADLLKQCEVAAAQRAFIFWNHPSWQGEERGRWGDVQTQLYNSQCLRGIEICNGVRYERQAHGWAIEKGLTLLGDSDIHEPFEESGRTADDHRTLTLVFAKERTPDALREALFAGRTAVWHGNRLFGSPQFLAPVYAVSVQVGPVHATSGNAAFVEIRNRCELRVELARVGPGSPRQITLCPGVTSLVGLDAADVENGAEYQATNFVIAPGKPLTVRIAPAKRPPPAAAAG